MRQCVRVGVIMTGAMLIATAAMAAPKKKKSAPKIPAAVIVENQHTVELIEFSLAPAGAEAKALVTYKKPIAPGKKVTIPVKGLKSCLVSVSATFADQGDSDSETDICADHVVRFVE